VKLKVRRILVSLAVAFGLLQLLPIDLTNPPVESDVAAPAPIQTVLRRTCYDCHSNETRRPWYSRVARASWLLTCDVHEGRRELNFSTWNAYGAGRQAKKLKETADEVRDRDMPPCYYVLMHRDARMTDADRIAVETWAAKASPGVPPETSHAE
jgi:hypothetical protein